MRFSAVPAHAVLVIFIVINPLSVSAADPAAGARRVKTECVDEGCFYEKAKTAIGEKAASCDTGVAEASACCLGKDLGKECSDKVFSSTPTASGAPSGGFPGSDATTPGDLMFLDAPTGGSGLLPGPADGSAGGKGGASTFAAMKGDKGLKSSASLLHYKYAGVCRRMAEYCEKSCSAEADKSKAGKCGEIKTRVAKAKSGGDDYKDAGSKIDPGAAGANPNGGGGGGGAGTQQPSTAQGGQGGGGMGDMMKALQGAMQPQNQDQQQEPFQSQTCEQNPALAGCKAKQPESDSWNKKQEKSDFQEQSTAGNADNFNVGNPSDGVNTQSLGGSGSEKPVGTPSTSAGIPNGGGQIPGGGGGGGTAAGGGAAGGYAGAQKNVTDVLHGAGGGGYSQMNANMQLQNGGGGGFGGYGGGAPSEYKSGVNLRDFLPGGKNDPTRKIAGGASSFEIQPQTVNIWSRISERFRARCTAGLLRDCEP